MQEAFCEYFYKKEGFVGLERRMQFTIKHFLLRRGDFKHKEMLSYPIGVAYSAALNRKEHLQYFLEKTKSECTITLMRENIDSYAEVCAVLLGYSGCAKDAIDILKNVHIKSKRLDILRKYLPLYSDHGKNIDDILKFILNE